jgi:hypothetical protein
MRMNQEICEVTSRTLPLQSLTMLNNEYCVINTVLLIVNTSGVAPYSFSFA